MSQPLAQHVFQEGELDAALAFLRRVRWELRELRFVRVWKDKLQVMDINKDYFQIDGVGYPQANIIPLLESVNTAFKREQIHLEVDDPYKEFRTGRRHPWAEDRVM